MFTSDTARNAVQNSRGVQKGPQKPLWLLWNCWLGNTARCHGRVGTNVGTDEDTTGEHSRIGPSLLQELIADGRKPYVFLGTTWPHEPRPKKRPRPLLTCNRQPHSPHAEVDPTILREGIERRWDLVERRVR